MIWITTAGLILRIIVFILERAKEREQQGIGYAKAVADSAAEAQRWIAEADAERILADQAHQNPTDDAFDKDYRRD